MRCELVTIKLKTVAPIGESKVAYLKSDDGENFLLECDGFEAEFNVSAFIDGLQRIAK